MLAQETALPIDITPLEGTSATGQLWQWRTTDAHAVAEASRYLQLPELLARILVGRGLTLDTIPDYLEPTLRALMPDPSHLRDMDKATERLTQAIKNKETIAVFGDYDVDGATSSALLIRYFRELGIELLYHIPDRQKEGYGPNAPALLGLQERGASLVITVDCGAVSFEPLAEAAKAGLDVIVIDHHKGAAQLPDAVAVVNPNRLDETSDYGHLAAAGVTFLVLVALHKSLREDGFFNDKPTPDLRHLLDIVALGTVCDVVSLTTLNRAFVTQGLKIIQSRRNAGLAALMDNAGAVGEPSTYTLGFMLGPRINAGGRVGESDLGVRLLTSTDPQEQHAISASLSRYNDERKAIEMDVLERAMEQAARQTNHDMIMVAGAGWHPGVIGIVASRIKDRFHRPAAVIAIDNGIGKASVRSVSGVDIGATIVAAREQGIIIEGGGHAMAGGFSVNEDAIDAAHNFLMERIAADMKHYLQTRSLSVDAPITTAMATPATIEMMNRAAPFGMGNPSPRVVLRDAKIIAIDILKDQHLRVILTDTSGGRLKAMSFRSVGTPLGDALQSSYGKTLHLAGSLKLEHWQGRQQISFMIDDVMLP